MTKYESADLLLKLYDLRREQKLREARDWWNKFKPKTVDDIKKVAYGPDSLKFRIVLGYWEMAAALVNHGAIDEQMFYDTVGEHLFIYAKLQPFLKEIREQEPNTLMQVEKLIKKMPDSEKRLEHIKTIISRM
jgi:hypothetical protein